jgi:hypothetical protein
MTIAAVFVDFVTYGISDVGTSELTQKYLRTDLISKVLYVLLLVIAP